MVDPLVIHLTVAELRAIVAQELDAALGRAVEAEVLTTDQVAQRWQMHPKTIARLVRQEGLPARRVSGGDRGDYRFLASEVNTWFEGRK